MANPIRAKKSLGQNFLVDDSYCQRIVNFADVRPEEIVVEIGPGTGRLTRLLLQRSCQVVGIEFDRDLVRHLNDSLQSEDLSLSNFQIIHADALNLDWTALFDQMARFQTPSRTHEPPRNIKLVGNLPYNISTRLLTMTSQFRNRFQSFTFMVQREVAMRIQAAPGSKDYGYLTLVLEYHYHRIRGFDVPPGAFIPRPKVLSHVMQLIPRTETPQVENYEAFVALIQRAFRHRRKTLWNNLAASHYPKQALEAAFHEAGLSRSMRPEQVGLSGYLSLTRVLCLRA